MSLSTFYENSIKKGGKKKEKKGKNINNQYSAIVQHIIKISQ